jgi:Concanavalin A-like lectin/glucanases superfamily
MSTAQLSKTAKAMVFDGQNSLVSLTQPLPAMPAGATIEFWAFSADALPQYTCVFASGKDYNSRVLNIHLSWVDGTIYWDSGSEGAAFDRIQKAAEPRDYKGSWTHCAFVKDVAGGTVHLPRRRTLAP